MHQPFRKMVNERTERLVVSFNEGSLVKSALLAHPVGASKTLIFTSLHRSGRNRGSAHLPQSGVIARVVYWHGPLSGPQKNGGHRMEDDRHFAYGCFAMTSSPNCRQSSQIAASGPLTSRGFSFRQNEQRPLQASCASSAKASSSLSSGKAVSASYTL